MSGGLLSRPRPASTSCWGLASPGGTAATVLTSFPSGCSLKPSGLAATTRRHPARSVVTLAPGGHGADHLPRPGRPAGRRPEVGPVSLPGGAAPRAAGPRRDSWWVGPQPRAGAELLASNTSDTPLVTASDRTGGHPCSSQRLASGPSRWPAPTPLQAGARQATKPDRPPTAACPPAGGVSHHVSAGRPLPGRLRGRSSGVEWAG